ncbi:hypothetical protein [Helicobacter sp. MIT 05-5294]|nr:hypothetical protein [Helicobacter sp. MIT 05-5294]
MQTKLLKVLSRDSILLSPYCVITDLSLMVRFCAAHCLACRLCQKK